MSNVGLYAKAIVGFLVTLLGGLATALVDEAVTPAEWAAIAAAAVSAGGAVWVVPNARSSHAPEPTHPPGYGPLDEPPGV